MNQQVKKCNLILKWEQFDTSTEYSIEIEEGDVWKQIVWIYNRDITSVTIPDMPENVQKHFRVCYWVNENGEKKLDYYKELYARSFGNVMYLFEHSNPHVVSVAIDDEQAKIRFQKISTIKKYRIFKKVGSGSWNAIGDTRGNVFFDESYDNRYDCAYTVRGLDDDRKDYLTDYDLDGYTVEGDAEQKQTVLAMPKITKVLPLQEGLKLAWRKVEGAEKYRIFSKSADGKWNQLTTVMGDVTEYIDESIKGGERKTYTIRCINADESAYTSDYDWTGIEFSFCETPHLLRAIKNSRGTLISWDIVDGAEKYRVFAKNEDSSWEAIGTSEANNNTYLYTKNQYSIFTVRCMNKDENVYMSGYDTQGIQVES